MKLKNRADRQTVSDCIQHGRIDWGTVDGNGNEIITTGQVELVQGGFAVYGTMPSQLSGVFSVTATLLDDGGTATGHSQDSVVTSVTKCGMDIYVSADSGSGSSFAFGDAVHIGAYAFDAAYAAGKSIASFIINWGDGNTTTTSANAWNTGGYTSYTCDDSHTYDDGGDYGITVTAVGSDGSTATTGVGITVMADPDYKLSIDTNPIKDVNDPNKIVGNAKTTEITVYKGKSGNFDIKVGDSENKAIAGAEVTAHHGELQPKATIEWVNGNASDSTGRVTATVTGSELGETSYHFKVQNPSGKWNEIIVTVKVVEAPAN